MATVIFIKESKQTPSAMRGCINYCVQEKKTVDSDGRQYVGGVNCLGTHAYEEFMATKTSYPGKDFPANSRPIRWASS